MHPQWNLPHYDSQPRQGRITLRHGDNPVLLKLVQSAGQRVRAYAAIDPPDANEDLALRWFSRPSDVTFNYMPRQPTSIGWYRFLAPPGLAVLDIKARGILKAWADGKPLAVSVIGQPAAGTSTRRYHAVVDAPSPDAVIVALRIIHEPGSSAGDALPEPVRIHCHPGRSALGDWSRYGLATYSGMAIYRRRVLLTQDQASSRVMLCLGNVAVTAEVYVNGKCCGCLICPPWMLDISGAVCEGNNELEIHIANTLANHYSVGIPTPYAQPEQTVSGLMGPVRLLFKGARHAS